ncbi:dickkopf-related protein 1-like isoform X1 [Syngnathoides biaculeatus]|uniref:dickkopf-related protein 1-like isoform X1 n=1 Tax=Syngnathoides biaculeatus TaxID=300417 RepID=UPI002ADE2A5F|nr:dickkopf-related protein 1-like isoform X1 [Syngnathoides biaculeatus]
MPIMLTPCAARCFLPLWLSLLGYAQAGPILLLNSNSIKNFEPVSPSPRTSPPPPPPPGGLGHKSSADALQQASVCADDDDCGGEEFCNDVRSVCLPCRRNRKRCARDSMCCAGSRCGNGVCQTNDFDGPESSTVSVWHLHNHTMEHHAKRPLAGPEGHPVKGQEGDTCLRSADCAAGLCCARHFWSRICKPVLTEGQVCTRHRRKGTHGLELFQRCDCGDGLACRPERGEREQHAGVGRTSARNLHTCQRR